MNNLVAVYGSLRKGLHNHRLLESSEAKGEDIVAGYAMHSLGGFPAITPCKEAPAVVVELYNVNEPTMKRLDSLEGYPRWYNRVQVDTTQGPAWIYYMEEPPTGPLVGGDWKAYVEEKGYA